VKISKHTRTYVSGSGWITESDDSRSHFSLLAKYSKKSGELYGHIKYWFRIQCDMYVVKAKGSQLLGLVIQGNYALIEAKCVVYQIGHKCHWDRIPEVVYLRVEVWDNGKGQSDVFRIQIFYESGELFHEAGFEPPGEVLWGNIRIRVYTWRWKCWCKDGW
jgi:hypothetical protein